MRLIGLYTWCQKPCPAGIPQRSREPRWATSTRHTAAWTLRCSGSDPGTVREETRLVKHWQLLCFDFSFITRCETQSILCGCEVKSSRCSTEEQIHLNALVGLLCRFHSMHRCFPECRASSVFGVKISDWWGSMCQSGLNVNCCI